MKGILSHPEITIRPEITITSELDCRAMFKRVLGWRVIQSTAASGDPSFNPLKLAAVSSVVSMRSDGRPSFTWSIFMVLNDGTTVNHFCVLSTCIHMAIYRDAHMDVGRGLEQQSSIPSAHTRTRPQQHCLLPRPAQRRWGSCRICAVAVSLWGRA